MKPIFVFLIIFSIFCKGYAEEKRSLKALYNSLDPLSIAQHLAFYELYADTKEGKESLSHAWKLLTAGKNREEILPLPLIGIEPMISLVTRQTSEAPVRLSGDQLALIEEISSSLGNRKLKGSRVWTRKELLELPSEEIDLARGVLIEQFDSGDKKQEIQNYEASIDLMALQILARFPQNPSSEDKIREINRFIFQEMLFRFPPHSLHAKDIDLYTFLPSVLDNRQGVCLGVSILYLALAQRLNLPLEIITPPGHIYVRYHDEKTLINIETTARGVDLPSDTYLGINTRYLEQRTMKEVIGMAFFNQASVYWGKEDYKTATALYEKALIYLPDDPLVKMLLGLNYLFEKRVREGKKLLQPLENFTFDYAVSPETLPADYLSGAIDAEGMKVVFLPVDETRESILEKQKKLEKILSRYPRFRAGLLQLATTWMQLSRGKEALDTLLLYHTIDSGDATVSYYLSVLSLQRLDFKGAWKFLKHTEKLTKNRHHFPKALKDLRAHLRRLCPEPEKNS